MVNTIYSYRIGYDEPSVFLPLFPYVSLFPYDDQGDGECEDGRHDHEVGDKEKDDGGGEGHGDGDGSGIRTVSGVRSLL